MYTLKEIEELRNQTIDAIADAIIRETADKPKTAKELAEACGLCSKYHIANSLQQHAPFFDRYGNRINASYQDKVDVKIGYKRVEKVRHFIEVDEDGNQIGTMTITNKYDLNTYQAIVKED